MLGLSIDTQDTLDDELLAEVSGIRFIAEEGFSYQFGGKFSIAVRDGKLSLSADALPNLGQPEGACTRQ